MEVSFGSNPSPFIYDRLGPEVISINEDSNLKRLFVGSQDEGASSRYSSYDILLSDGDVKGDHVAASMPVSSHVVETSISNALPTPKMQGSSLRRKCARDYSRLLKGIQSGS